MIDGLVSNCWQALLENGASLDDLLRAAEERSLRFVELRQTCLGEYESATFVPDVRGLAELAKRFPEMTLTLALCVPFMSGDLDLEGELITSGIAAAEALAGTNGAHLRLVDLSSPTGTGTGVTEEAVEALVSLALRLAEGNGVLALENAMHPWDQLLPLFRNGRGKLRSKKNCLQLCLDPCNVHLQEPKRADHEVPEGLHATDLSMVHIKQSGNGRVLPVVEAGDVNWSFALRRLREVDFSGPLLLEIAPSMEVWEQVERSVQFLEGLEPRGPRNQR